MGRFIVSFIAILGLAVLNPAAAEIITFTASLSGPAESPPNASPGTGFAIVDFDPLGHTMRVRVTFSGLLSTTVASHIHSATAVAGTGTAGVATTTPTFAGFPLGVTSGSYDNTLDMTLASSYNPAFVTANGGTTASAETALFAGMIAGKSYLNVHTVQFGGGEIRGFLTPVPAPPALFLAGAGAVTAGGFRLLRRRRVVV
jgi:CHRD domain